MLEIEVVDLLYKLSLLLDEPFVRQRLLMFAPYMNLTGP